MNAPARKFEAKPAVREQVPLLIGLIGPSGSGKTKSALRLATGIQAVTGGEIDVIDTEAKRALHYADEFKFNHVQFDAPFGSLDYLAAIQQSVARGAKVVVIDSMSHEHESTGGLIDLHEAELDRLAGSDYGKRERVKMLAWQKPKANRRKLINGILQLNCNFIFCFRAKETVKPTKINGKTEIVPQGFMPIAGDEFLFEQTANILLMPKSGGVPTWQSDNVGEKLMMKLPNYLAHAFSEKAPLDEQTGKLLATWARGDKAAAEPKSKTPATEPVPTADEYVARWDGLLDIVTSAKQLRDTWQEQAELREKIQWPDDGDKMFNELLARVKKQIKTLDRK